jgi:hypothetical protein
MADIVLMTDYANPPGVPAGSGRWTGQLKNEQADNQVVPEFLGGIGFRLYVARAYVAHTEDGRGVSSPPSNTVVV